MKGLLLLSFFFAIESMASTVLPFRFGLENTELIYGSDDRYEVDDYADAIFINKAKSVALKVSSRKLSENRDNSSIINFTTRKLKQTVPQICPDERFVNQVSLGDCSGFLISANTLVTAGHCMLSEQDCSGSKWVFDFKANTNVLKKSNVFSCKKIIKQKYIYNKLQVNDYAVIELDRPAFNRPALEYRKVGFVDQETSLVVIGHPLGLPMKITDGGRVTSYNNIEKENIIRSTILRRNYFTANLDTFAGNSGSPVFNYDSGKVEGILIQGADDFVFNQDRGCSESRHLSNNALNTYEKVMRINHIPGL